MKISILMSTYNGEKYIEEQLESIKNQTVEANEVIIIDDCSTDCTVDIINNYVKNNKITNWIVYENVVNKGWKKNFIEGIKKTTGDIVLFSDQDDIWCLDKIEIFEKEFIINNKINVIATGETLWYGDEVNNEHSTICGKTYPKLYERKNNFLIHCSGCSMGIRRKYYEKICSYYCDEWAHDDFFWKMAVLDESLMLLDGSSIFHRIHGKNESRKGRNKKTTIKGLENNIIICNQLMSYIKDGKDGKKQKKCIKNIIHQKKATKHRLELLKSGNLLSIIKLLFYLDTYRRKRQFLGDILLSFNVEIHGNEKEEK